MAEQSRFATTIEDLEHQTQVPLAEQVIEVPEAPADAIISEQALNAQRAVSIEHNFRW